jgi:hypothetical protein
VSGKSMPVDFKYHTAEYTQSGNCHFVAYIISWWKNQPRWGWGVARPPPLTYIYHHVQSYGLPSNWEGGYTLPICTLPLCVLCVVNCLTIYSNLYSMYSMYSPRASSFSLKVSQLLVLPEGLSTCSREKVLLCTHKWKLESLLQIQGVLSLLDK